MKFFLIPLSLLLSFQLAEAKVFSNAYLSFELPASWKCKVRRTEWICYHNEAKSTKKAIIILTAKEKSSQDSLSEFKKILSSSKKNKVRGSVISSKVQNMKERLLNSQRWIDSLHLNSEIQHYYTRYLATTKGQIAVLVTFSAHKKHFTQYATDFLTAINTLKLINSKSLWSNPSGSNVRGSNSPLGAPIGGILTSELDNGVLLEGEIEDADGAQRSQMSKNQKILFGILGFIAALALGFFVLSRRKKRR